MFKGIQVKLKTGLAVVLTTATVFTFAQSYNITPNDTFMDLTPFNKLSHFTIQQNNLTNGKLLFNWQQLVLNIPSGWTANLCDNGHCYADFPVKGKMDTVFKSEYGMMSLGIDPGMVSGTALIRYAIWEQSTPENMDTLTWIISSNSATGFTETEPDKSLLIFVDVSGDNIHLLTSLNKGFYCSISDISGKQVYSENFIFSTANISSENFPNGFYNILIMDSNKNIKTKKIMIQH
ncbi:MAG: T9SS type A sorting domain-containing protein [Bacteroidia bacterium]|nr:T9SS type A sorting domain-containing protein [Bacteroidia bacterium]